MKSGLFKLNNEDGIKIVINFFIGMFITVVGESLLNQGMPGCFADLMTIIKGGVYMAAASTSRRFLTNGDGEFLTKGTPKDAQIPA